MVSQLEDLEHSHQDKAAEEIINALGKGTIYRCPCTDQMLVTPHIRLFAQEEAMIISEVCTRNKCTWILTRMQLDGDRLFMPELIISADMFEIMKEL